jgi:hypothetical protein
MPNPQTSVFSSNNFYIKKKTLINTILIVKGTIIGAGINMNAVNKNSYNTHTIFFILKIKFFLKIIKTSTLMFSTQVSKIFFKGKGFKFKKLLNSLLLYFNKSHKVLLFTRESLLKKTTKNFILVINDFLCCKQKNIKNIIKTMPTNSYTKNGIRLLLQKKK